MSLMTLNVTGSIYPEIEDSAYYHRSSFCTHFMQPVVDTFAKSRCKVYFVQDYIPFFFCLFFRILPSSRLVVKVWEAGPHSEIFMPGICVSFNAVFSTP